MQNAILAIELFAFFLLINNRIRDIQKGSGIMPKNTYTIQEACAVIRKPPMYIWRIINYFRIPYAKDDKGKVLINKTYFDFVVRQLRLKRYDSKELKKKEVPQEIPVESTTTQENISTQSKEESQKEETAKEEVNNGKKTKAKSSKTNRNSRSRVKKAKS